MIGRKKELLLLLLLLLYGLLLDKKVLLFAGKIKWLLKAVKSFLTKDLIEFEITTFVTDDGSFYFQYNNNNKFRITRKVNDYDVFELLF